MDSKDHAVMFTIVLPTYNVGEYIDRCIASCINQSYSDFEVIIIDDCGTDDSIEKARHWAQKDSRIRLIRNPRNLGTFHARRRGVEEANGEYILFLDPDDEIHTKTLEVINCAISEGNADIILYGVSMAGRRKQKIKLPNNCESNGDVIRCVFLETKRLAYGTAGKAFSKSSLSQAFSALDVSESERLVYAEDVLIFFAASLFAKRLISIGEALYKYHREQGSITNNNEPHHIRQKTNQIYMVSSYLYRVLSSRRDLSANAEDAGKKVICKLISDAALLRRYSKSEGGKSEYIKRVFESFRMRWDVADVVRILIYLATMKKIRL